MNLYPLGRFFNLSRIPFALVFVFVMRLSDAVQAQEKIGVQFRTGQFLFPPELRQDQMDQALALGRTSRYYYTLIAFDRLPNPKAMDYLRAAGTEFLEKISDGIYSVRFSRKPDLMMCRTSGIKAMQPMPARVKTAIPLAERIRAGKSEEYIKISLLLYPGENSAALLSLAEQSGFSVQSKQYADQGLYIGMMQAGKMESLAALPFVRQINLFDYKIEPLLQTETGVFALSTLKGNQLSGRSLSGKDIAVGVGDNADPTSHIDLLQDVQNRNPSPPLYSSHGTRVSGIVSGDGLIEENYTGIAPDTKVIADYYDFVLTKSPVYKKDFGMTITNNSYYNGYVGCPGNGAYNELSVFADQQITQDTVLLHVFAAGNDGTRTCSPYPLSYATVKSGYQTSKNVLSVGDYYIYNPPAIYQTSSRGPVSDGRLKPEIIAPGGNFWATTINNNYNNGFGTSFAAPMVTGVYALLAQRYRQLHNNAMPASALMKAILCNTAADKGNPGPDFLHGFGLIHPVRALRALEQGRYAKGTVSQGGQFQYNLAIPQGTKRIKVMLYWHDPAGSPLAQTTLQHDLDLQVKENSQTYLPWLLNPAPAQVMNAAVRGIDRLNNIEQVTLDNPVSGNVQIEVNGYAVMNGSQDFYITWDFYDDELTLLHPVGGEKFTFGLGVPYEGITWDAPENISDSLTIEYSANNGSSWTQIATNVPANRYWYLWTIPNVSVPQAKIRLTRKSNNVTATTPGSFTIMPRPLVSSAVPCEGAVNLSWAAIGNVTDYEVFQLQNNVWQKIGTTSGLQYQVRGLDRSVRYWFSVRCRVTDSSGRRSKAIAVTPSATTPCTAVEFDKDLKADRLVSPVSGRKNTSTQLSNAQEIIVKIKNLDDVPSTANYNISYQINNGAIVTEPSNIVIPASGSIDYAFTTTADLSAVDSFRIKVFVKQAGDQRPENDELSVVVRHLDNPVVALPHMEDFENTGEDEYRANTFGMKNIDRFDYVLSTTNGRARTFVNSGMAPSGNKAITLDAAQYLGAVNINQLTGTYNFSNLSATDELRLDFQYKNQGQLNLPSGMVWVRGNDDAAWINAYELVNDRNRLGQVRTGWVNIREVMDAAGQTFSSSFQIFFQQYGRTSSNNADYFPEVFDLDDGLTIDNIRFSKASNDLMLSKIQSPDSLICTSGNFQSSVTVSVKNLSSTVQTNVPVYYRLDNQAPVQEIIASIPAGTEINYTFTTPLSVTGNGKYTLNAWVASPADDYPVNDTIAGYTIYVSAPVTAFPYLETFENNPAGWFTSNLYSSWSWGTTDSLTRSVLKSAANGTKSWFTSLSGAYNSNEFSYLYTPCFNLSGLTSPVLSFSHIFRQERGRDIHWLEYSTNNGVSWQKLGLQNTGTNWYDTTANFWNRDLQRWHVSSADLPAGEPSVRFRFLFSSDDFNQYDGVGIDDFHVFDKATVYEGTSTSDVQPVSGNEWIHFRSQNQLIASIHPMGQQLGDVQVNVFINQDSVRLLNNQYYMDRNLVIQSQNTPTDSVKIRFYFTEEEIKKMINTTKCIPCIKLSNAYIASVTQYSGLPEYENGMLNDGAGGNYTFIPASSVEIIPFNNGYYAEFKVRSFSEFWIHALDYNLSQIPLSVSNPVVTPHFITHTSLSASGQLLIVPANQRGIQQMNIRLINAGGQEVLNLSKSYQRSVIEAGHLANGIYFITISDNAGKYFYRSKIIK